MDDGKANLGSRKATERLKRVVFTRRFFYPDGSATLLMLTDLVSALGNQYYAMHVITSAARYAGSADRQPAREMVDGALVHRLPAFAGGQTWLVKRLANFALFYLFCFFALLRLAGRGHVIVCLTDPPFVQLPCLFVGKLKKAHLVNFVQNIYPETAVRLGCGSTSNPVFRLLSALRDQCWRASVANVAIGVRLGEYIAQRTAGTARVQIISNWADETALTTLDPADNPPRAVWGFATGDCVVGYSGNLGRSHDSETMLGAIEELAQDASPAAHFLCIGREAQRSAFEARLGDSDSVRIRAHQLREELRVGLAVPDIHWLLLEPQFERLIVPSKFYGVAAAGRPTIFIGDKDGEIARLIAQSKCGRSFAPGASAALAQYLRTLEQDPALRRDLGRKAGSFAVEVCASDQRLAEWTELLSELTAGASCSAPHSAAQRDASGRDPFTSRASRP